MLFRYQCTFKAARYTRVIAIALLCAGICTGAASSTSTKPATSTALKPATAATSAKPLTTASSRPATTTAVSKVIQADDLLAKFPAALTRAPKNTKVTIEGRLVDIRTVPPTATTSTQKSSTIQLQIVGKKQPDDDTAHLTCMLDPSLEKTALDLKPGAIVQLTGEVATTNTDLKRLDLDNCTELRILAAPSAAPPMVIGHWEGQLPSIPAVAASFEFRRDQTVTFAFSSNGRSASLQGKWASNADDENQFQVTLEKTDGPVMVLATRGKLLVPSIAPLFYLQGVKYIEFSQPAGSTSSPKLEPIDFKGNQNLVLQWIRTNVDAAHGQNVLGSATKLGETATSHKNGFSVTIGGDILKSHTTTEVITFNNKMFILEYTEAQAKATGLASDAIRTLERTTNYPALPSFVKIDDITFDSKTIPASVTPFKGKISFHLTHLPSHSEYFLLMEHEKVKTAKPLKQAPNLDSVTVEFAGISLAPRLAQPGGVSNPLTIFFSIAIGSPETSEYYRVSDSHAVLFDFKR